MKLKQLKLLTAALVLATSGSAHAIIVDGLYGDSELFMTLWDVEGEQSYILDLNVRMTSFLSGVEIGQTWYYPADATMIEFLGMVSDANKPRMRYVIAAIDTYGAQQHDYYRYISTASEIDVTDTKSNLSIMKMGTNANIFLGDVNSTLLSKNSEIYTDTNRLAYAGSGVWGNRWGGDMFGGTSNFLATGEIGTSMGVYLIRQSDGRFARRHDRSIYQPLTYNGLPYQANLDMNGNLRIAPVPEPETYALMLAGLGLVGWMARRRKAV